MAEPEKDISPEHVPVVVLVDQDEEAYRALAAMQDQFRLQRFSSPAEALEYFKLTSPDVVISEYLLPGMNGLEFLYRVRHMYPDVPRVMLTAYADKESAIRGINEAGLFQFIQKPWDDESIRLMIKNALANKNLNHALQQKIHEIDEILRQKEALFQSQHLMRQELSLAKQVHSRLLPPRTIQCHGLSIDVHYRPSFDIGGDFYDVMPLADHRLAILISDLTGHGIQAALCTALLKFAFSEYRNSDADGLEIMRGMNEVLYRGLPSDFYAATLLLVLDTKTYEGMAYNGGVPHPLILHRRTAQLDKIFTNGMILGMFTEDIFYTQEGVSFHLGPDDLLLLFTDGLTEVRNEKGEFFGDRLVARTVQNHAASSPRELLERLVQDAVEFKSARDRFDDITVLAIRRL